MIHPEEDLIAEHSFQHGLVETRRNVAYDSSSVDRLPEALRNYWKVKEDPGKGREELMRAGDRAVEWIQENQDDEKSFISRVWNR